MHGSEEDHLPRNRPLSGGIWTLFSWLRRSEQSSCESISSVGSDRSVASFDFLGPTEYVTSRPPLTISAKDPTDSYNKRLYDLDIRRQRDHDMTLHRKYGLLRFQGYDSLPVKGSNLHHQQRATSECYQRRTPYVPGKRRAPLPPTTVVAVTLPRYKRKRPAPKPPNIISSNNKENVEQRKVMPMSNTTGINSDLQSRASYKTAKNKEKVLKDNKSFLKQFFENRKSLNVDTSHVKFLPSISELDKQALEIIEKKKALKSTMGDVFDLTSPSENPWICTKCLRKYQSSIVFCLHCQKKEVSKEDNSPKRLSKINLNIPNEDKTTVEKEKLKLMLKEMKNSLPKRSIQKIENNTFPSESSTLRIGDNVSDNQSSTTSEVSENLKFKTKQLDSIPELRKTGSKHSDILLNRVSLKEVSKQNSTNKTLRETDSVSCTNTNVIYNASVAHKNVGSNISYISKADNSCASNKGQKTHANIKQSQVDDKSPKTNKINSIDAAVTDPPLKISSLLSPLNQDDKTKNIALPSLSAEKFKPLSNSKVTDPSFRVSPSTSSDLQGVKKVNNDNCKNNNNNGNYATKASVTPSSNDVNLNPVNKNLEILSHHSRRRNLVSQLEQSISKGDVKTAAEAAAELAKLRLSCSVLSFSSQIVAESSVVSANNSKIATSMTANAVKSETTEQSKLRSQNITKVEKNTKILSSESKETKSVSFKTAKEAAVQPGPSRLNIDEAKESVTINVWIEDKETARGPVKVTIGRHAIMEDLMKHADTYLGLPIHLQRWIVGKNLCTDNKTKLSALAGIDFSAPFYLCLVQSESNESDEKTASRKRGQNETQKASSNATCSDVYKELINLEKEAIVLNSEPFECEVCLEPCGQGEGVVLRECIHIFCKKCVADAVKHCQDPVVACPAFNCSGTLQEREIRALLSFDEYERWLARGLVTAESGTRNTFHCRTTDCKGWAFCEPGVRRFPCPVCKHTNCIPCQAIHEGNTCENYKEKLQKAVLLAGKNQVDEETQSFLDSLIQRGEAIACPECNTIITKKWGCDWIKCFACKTEICWVTKGRRWGPAGKGDTSGGCRCGIDGKRCHPTCSYCH